MKTLLLISLVALAMGAGPATKPKEPGKVVDPRRDGITHPADIIVSLPAEAAPANGAWDEFSLPKANKWIEGNAEGCTFDFSMKLKEVDFERIFHENDPNETLGWLVKITLSHEPLKNGKGAIAVDDVRVHIHGDEALARACKKWNNGEVVQLSGVIIQAGIMPDRSRTLPKKGEPDIRSHIAMRFGQVNLKSVGKWVQPAPK